MEFDLFVLPFSLCLLYLTVYLGITYYRWYKALPDPERSKARQYALTSRSLTAIWEVVMESLLHRKMFRKNGLLGYMHMSFAFGWFMLILVGNIESRIASGTHINLPYYPIFFKFFHHQKDSFPLQAGFNFIMDLFLLLVLSGVMLALIKRGRSRLFSLKRTTIHTPLDQFALFSLWSIFPLRFMAESLTSAQFENGHFFTHNAGLLFSHFLPVSDLMYPAWWAYSTALGVFFMALPFSRYMHIPTEIFLIFLRHYGIETSRSNTTFAKFEIYSCSSCGVCLDTCQLNSVFDNNPVPPSYFLKKERNQRFDETSLNSCLVCGRCQEACPVGINVNGIRVNARNRHEIPGNHGYMQFEYHRSKKAKALYFAGCMSQLTPGIKKAMKEIIDVADLPVHFMDEFETICCGRPMMLSGQYRQAEEMIRKNKKAIEESGAEVMIVSCPICYKVFVDDYKLDIRVLHHTEWIYELLSNRKIILKQDTLRTFYHDPCDLARGENIYEAPRKVLDSFTQLAQSEFDGRQSLCCGGSLGGLKLSFEERKTITKDALERMDVSASDVLVTSCPLCKKTFAALAEIPVMDISELVAESLKTRKANNKPSYKNKVEKLLKMY